MRSPHVTAAEEPRDAGMSLIEVLVAMGLFSVLGTLVLGLALSTSKVTGDVRTLTNVNEESRMAMERLTRELRQATRITDVRLPGDPTDTTALTFWTDFDGNGVPDLNAADPEVLTYRWDPATKRLTLTANDASGAATTRPVLAATVSSFTLRLLSSQWQHDSDGNGETTWQELDVAAAGGNANGKPDGTELDRVDLVGLELTVLDGDRAQTYSTRVDLRNRG